MLRKTLLHIVYATLVSANIFILICIATIFISQEYRVDFEVGFPRTFYYQFLVDADVQHGFKGLEFLYDTFLTWILTIVVWFSLKKYS